MNELIRTLAVQAAGTMSDSALAALSRGLPDAELAVMVRQAMGALPASVQLPKTLAERAVIKEPAPKVSGRHNETPIQDAVLEVLKEYPEGLTFTAIRKLCGASKGSAYAACERHLREGKVLRIGNGQGSTWKLVQDGF